MNVLFVNDSTSNPNWGDRAASLTLQRLIAEAGATITHRITEYELGSGAFLGAPADAAAPAAAGGPRWLHLCLPPAAVKLAGRLRARRGRRPPLAIPERLDQFAARRRRFMTGAGPCAELRAAIAQADVAVVHGDGCMVGRGPLPRAMLFLCHVLKTEFAKPVILVNHTADFDHPDLLAMARAVYPLLDDVVYRDRASAARWQNEWSGRYAADSAFLLEPAPRDAWLPLAARPGYFDVWPDAARFDPGRPYLCLGGSSIYAFGGEPAAITAQFAALIEQLREVFAGQIVLTASDGKDQWIFRPLAERLGLPLVGVATPVQQAVDIVGNAAAYIGGRWHASIFALRGGTPVIPLAAKTFKMQALAEMAALGAGPFDAMDLAAAGRDIGRALADSLRQGEALRARLRAFAASQAASSPANVSFLGRLA